MIPTLTFVQLIYIFKKEDILKTQEREARGLKAGKEKRVSQNTSLIDALLYSTVINDELKNHIKDVMKINWHFRHC